MDCGLGNLATLKTAILPVANQAETQFDAALQQIGKGVAGMFDLYCTRDLARSVAVEFITSARRSYVSLPHTPVESVASVSLRSAVATGWVVQSDVIVQLDQQAGLVDFATVLGIEDDRIKIVYTGGFWFEIAEPGDVDYPTTQPTGSTARPQALLAAWLMQCRAEAVARDVLGTAAVGQEPKGTQLITVELLPGVRLALERYRRFAQ